MAPSWLRRACVLLAMLIFFIFNVVGAAKSEKRRNFSSEQARREEAMRLFDLVCDDNHLPKIASCKAQDMLGLCSHAWLFHSLPSFDSCLDSGPVVWAEGDGKGSCRCLR